MVRSSRLLFLTLGIGGLALGMPEPSRATGCVPSSHCINPYQGTELSVSLQAPFPDTGDLWDHIAGSGAHCTPPSTENPNGWFADCWALDLNYKGSSDVDDEMPVLAAAEGTIDRAEEDTTGYGYLVKIGHTQGGTTFYTLYAHMKRELLVADEEEVEEGQVIGFISNTGVSANHLHFSMRTSGNNTAFTQDLDGQPMSGAPSGNLTLASSADLYFKDEFTAPISGWHSPSVLTRDNGLGRIEGPGGGVGYVIPYKYGLHVRSGKGAYLLEYATRFAPGTTGTLSLHVDNWGFGAPGNRSFLGVVNAGWGTTDTRQGWEVYSHVFDYGDFPTGTRFIRPQIRTSTDFVGPAEIDYVRFRENAPATVGGNVRFRAYNRGGATELEWEVSDPAAVDSFEVQRATSKDGSYTTVATVSGNPGSNWYSSRDLGITPFGRYYYRLQIAGSSTSREVGPIGPVETYVVHDIPGLGPSYVYTDMADVPSWADYPGSSFDGDGDTYGLINYNPDVVNVWIVPMSITGFRSIRTYFGGNTNNWSASVVRADTNAVISLGQTSNNFLEETSLTMPLGGVGAPLRQINLTFERTNWDYFFHNAEIVFSQDP